MCAQHTLLDTVRKDDANALCKALQAGADVRRTDACSGRTLLHWAAAAGSLRCLEALLEQGLDPGAVDVHRMTALHLAVRYRRHHCIPLLLEKCQQPNVAELREYGNTPLLTAIRQGDRESVRLLLDDMRVDTNVVDRTGLSPLHVAIQCGNITEVVKGLLGRGAHPKKMADGSEIENPISREFLNYRRTPLHMAAEAGGAETIHLLVRAGADVNALDVGRLSALHVALLSGNDEAGGVLLHYRGQSHGLLDNLKDSKGIRPIHLAAANGLEHSLALLLYRTVDPDQTTGEQMMTPLMLAVEGGHSGCVDSLLLQDGVDLNRQDQAGETALHKAVQESARWMCINPLLVAGAGLEIQDRFGHTPLYASLYTTLETKWPDFSCMNYLLQQGANPNVLDIDGGNMLHTVIDNEDFGDAHVDYLLDIGVATDVRDKKGKTPLVLAVERRRVRDVKALLSAGAGPDMPDGRGVTPACKAAKAGNGAILSILLAYGASTTGVERAIAKSRKGKQARAELLALVRPRPSENGPQQAGNEPQSLSPG